MAESMISAADAALLADRNDGMWGGGGAFFWVFALLLLSGGGLEASAIAAPVRMSPPRNSFRMQRITRLHRLEFSRFFSVPQTTITRTRSLLTGRLIP